MSGAEARTGAAAVAPQGEPSGAGATSQTVLRGSLAPDVSVEQLWEALRGGLGNAESEDVKARLGLAPESGDREVAAKLLRLLVASELSRVSLRRASEPLSEPPPAKAERISRVPEAERPPDAARLERETATDVGNIADVRTLVALVRGGRLDARRAAVARLRALLEGRKALAPDDTRAAIRFLEGYRAGDLAYELLLARAALPAAEGRRARAERERMRETGQRVLEQLDAFWDGQELADPVAALPGDERITFLSALRDMPDAVAAHVAAIVEGSGGVLEPGARHELLGSLRFSSDPRLVPALRSALESSEPDIVQDAARVLARVEDPRVRPVLVAAYERAHRESTRLVLAAALGLLGDARGREFARASLGLGDPSIRVVAIEAMGAVGEPEDLERLVPFLDDSDPLVVLASIRAVGRVGDARAVGVLRAMARRAPKASLRAEIDDALDAIEARMELRGEHAPSEESAEISRLSMIPQGVRPAASAWARIRAVRHYLLGRFWLLVGAYAAAQIRFEHASASRPGWSAPHLAGAVALEYRGEYARALVGFRRALEVDRVTVERDPIVMRSLLRCFLRRAEQLRSEGRLPIARGLLDEALGLDWRWVFSPTLRFEVTRLHTRLTREMERNA